MRTPVRSTSIAVSARMASKNAGYLRSDNAQNRQGEAEGDGARPIPQQAGRPQVVNLLTSSPGLAGYYGDTITESFWVVTAGASNY